MKKLMLDTNFLVLPFQFQVDPFEEFDKIFTENYNLYTIDKCISEAKTIENNSYSSLVTKLIEKKPIEVIDTSSSKNADDLLLEFSERGYVVCTNDRELRERIKKKGSPVVILRGENKLQYQVP